MPIVQFDRWKLFRFRVVNEYLWQELELAEMYACKPEKLNDPFDCQIDPLHSLNRAIHDCRDPGRSNLLLEIRKDFLDLDPLTKERSVCCFSVSAQNHLMWSHYADHHRGVCLLYDFPAEYIPSRYSSETGDPFYMVGCASVDYGENEFYKWLFEGDINDPISSQPTVNAAAKLLVSKAPCWSYEEEVRLIMSQPGFVGYDRNHLTQVIFGLRTPERQMALIRSLLRKQNSDVTFVRTLRDADTDFGLKFVEEES